jgi:hypothetical protein
MCVQAEGEFSEATFSKLADKAARWGTERENANYILEKKNTKRSTLQHVRTYQCWQKDVCSDDRPIETLSRLELVERLPIFILQVRVSFGRISQLKLHICHYEVESAFELKSQFLVHALSL